jgi:predicted nucleic acid-binding Zn ribbon protein
MEFVFHCILCAGPIPEERLRHGACTCSPEHQREYKRRKRALRKISMAGDHCRACGRALPKVTGGPKVAPRGCATGARGILANSQEASDPSASPAGSIESCGKQVQIRDG